MTFFKRRSRKWAWIFHMLLSLNILKNNKWLDIIWLCVITSAAQVWTIDPDSRNSPPFILIGHNCRIKMNGIWNFDSRQSPLCVYIQPCWPINRWCSVSIVSLCVRQRSKSTGTRGEIKWRMIRARACLLWETMCGYFEYAPIAPCSLQISISGHLSFPGKRGKERDDELSRSLFLNLARPVYVRDKI